VTIDAPSPRPSPAPSGVEPASLLARAWELSYLDAHRSAALALEVLDGLQERTTDLDRAWAWTLVALSEARLGDAARAESAARTARELFDKAPPPDRIRGIALTDEVLAIHHRRLGRHEESAALQRDIDARPGRQYTDHDLFIAHNSRAITAKQLGRTDEALRHFYAAHAAARRTGWSGPLILSLGNLGSYHQDLYNFDDACRLCQEALLMAREAGAVQAQLVAAANLVVIHHALGQMKQAHAMAKLIVELGPTVPERLLERLTGPLGLGHLAVGDLDAAQAYLDRGATSLLGDGDGRAHWSWVQARCALARDEVARARAVTAAVMAEHEAGTLTAQPYDLLQIERVAAEAAERDGDLATALACTRRAQRHYEELVGRSARARFLALEVAHEVESARRERDQAVRSRETAEHDRARLAELNAALQAKIAETERLQTLLREQALRDPLTGLHNRRYLFEAGPQLVELTRRQDSGLCLVLLDLDRFKALNDQHGHHAGDQVLQAFAQLLQMTVRRSDIVCRHGGEEFVLLMPHIDPHGAHALLARLLEAYAQMQVEFRRHPEATPQLLGGLTFSAGLAVAPNHGGTLDVLLSRADRALYAAKDAGRARIEVAETTGHAAL
jgi:diguanylate cyclase (GGDEF)-like protein